MEEKVGQMKLSRSWVQDPVQPEAKGCEGTVGFMGSRMGERYAPVVRGECGDGISSHHTRVGENCFSEIYKFI